MTEPILHLTPSELRTLLEAVEAGDPIWDVADTALTQYGQPSDSQPQQPDS